MTAALRTVPRGRPSAADLTASLEAARRVNVNLRAELHAERAESIEFAEFVRGCGIQAYGATVTGNLDKIAHEAAAIVVKADRHLRQRGRVPA